MFCECVLFCSFCFLLKTKIHPRIQKVDSGMQTNKLPYGSQRRGQLIPVIAFSSIGDYPSGTSFIYVGSPWVSFANLKYIELNIKFPLNRHLNIHERQCEQSHIYNPCMYHLSFSGLKCAQMTKVHNQDLFQVTGNVRFQLSDFSELKLSS